jgi:DNA invertase Pin-like site-specific DNA recombinase
MQRDALNAAGCERIFEDTASGTKTDRPGLDQCLAYLRGEQDTLVVWKLDRLGRSLPHLIEVVADLERRSVGFRSLKEAIDTSSSVGKLIFHIFAALADFERGIIVERTMAGLTAARARGRLGGRPKKLTADKIRLVTALLKDNSYSIKDIAGQIGVSASTLYQFIGSLKSVQVEENLCRRSVSTKSQTLLSTDY